MIDSSSREAEKVKVKREPAKDAEIPVLFAAGYGSLDAWYPEKTRCMIHRLHPVPSNRHQGSGLLFMVKSPLENHIIGI